MAIKPIDTEVFVQNLKQAYTILRQNILICNTMVEMISNFNSLNDNDAQLTASINEIKQQLAQNERDITQNESDIGDLQSRVGTLDTDLERLNTHVEDIAEDLTKKVTASSTPKIIYGTNASAPFLYQVKLSDEPMEAGTDRSVPTTAYVWRAITEKISEVNTNIPNQTEFVILEDGTYALRLKNEYYDNINTDTSINKIINPVSSLAYKTIEVEDTANDLQIDNKYTNITLEVNILSQDKNVYLNNFQGYLTITMARAGEGTLIIHIGNKKFIYSKNSDNPILLDYHGGSTDNKLLFKKTSTSQSFMNLIVDKWLLLNYATIYDI